MWFTILIDLMLPHVWSWKYPYIREYSCHSSSHRTISWIDLVHTPQYASPTILYQVCNISLLPRDIFHHAPGLLHLTLTEVPINKLWKLLPLNGPHSYKWMLCQILPYLIFLQDLIKQMGLTPILGIPQSFQLLTAQRQAPHNPITFRKFQLTIAALQSSKTPGPDGLTIEFYLT